MLAIIFTALVAFFVSSLFGYVVHRSLHQPWAGKLNQKHMTHHLTLYPATDYLSDKYRDAGGDNTVIIFSIAAIPVVAAPILLGVFGLLPLSLVITALVIMGLMGFLHSYLHDSFHIRNHFLTRIPGVRVIFAYWNHLHYLHHIDMQKNFGIFLFHWDHIFKTFWKEPKQ
jgi:sterol desaturase/sphingolipid hydroxylase (fatty acid hydroxylase superfamily)